MISFLALSRHGRVHKLVSQLKGNLRAHRIQFAELVQNIHDIQIYNKR